MLILSRCTEGDYLNDMAKNLVLWLIIAAVLVTVMNNFSGKTETQRLNYSEFIEQVNEGKVQQVTVDGFVISGKRADGSTFETVRPAIQDNGLIGDLIENKVTVIGKQPEQQSIWTQLLVASFPILVIIAVFMFFMRQMQGGAGGTNAHKGTYGHVLLLAGSPGKTGAAAMCELSALRIGAGLVTLALPESLNDAMEAKLTEVMTEPLP